MRNAQCAIAGDSSIIERFVAAKSTNSIFNTKKLSRLIFQTTFTFFIAFARRNGVTFLKESNQRTFLVLRIANCELQGQVLVIACLYSFDNACLEAVILKGSHTLDCSAAR